MDAAQRPTAMKYNWPLLAALISITGLLFGAGLVVASPAVEDYLCVETPVARADALVLMAGSRGERLPAIARLYHAGIAPRILLTNDGVSGAFSREHGRNLYLVEWTEVELLKRGVPPEAIVKLDFIASGSVYDALNTRSFVRSDGGIRSLLVVTSDYHTRRTLWTFEKVFADDPVEIGVHPADTPPRSGGARVRIQAVELLKTICYRVWFRVYPATFRGDGLEGRALPAGPAALESPI
jgi:uncharacterized SAM-binding protein YcdF (DUF218 family)